MTPTCEQMMGEWVPPPRRTHAPVQTGSYARRMAGSERTYRYPDKIPWDLHVRAWQVYAACGHRSQSAERIAERGGFGITELYTLLAECNPWTDGDPITADQRRMLEHLRSEGLEA